MIHDISAWKVLPWAVGYMTVFLVAIIIFVWFLKKSRHRKKKPFPEDVKLMRMPGEHLWSEIRKFEENDDTHFLGGLVLPLVAGLIAIYLTEPLLSQMPYVAIILVIATFSFSLVSSARFLARRLLERDDYYLGFFGERYVAEYLEPLKSKGWCILHDLPCEGATGKFNIDHVAIGPNGVWVIETKCVRKGEAKEGLKEYEVSFDGRELQWPWGERNRRGLDQALNNSRWLREYIQRLTTKEVSIHTVVVFPGWNVIERKLAQVRVANPKNLSDVLTGRKMEPLIPEDVELLSALLTEKCRTVSY